tara:strand:- start:175 stop:654 length:480 start_codon:yes stop_codon:yes gene_type:complete
MNKFSIYLILLISFCSFSLPEKSFSKGDLTRQKPIQIDVFLSGKIGESHYYKPSVLKFETGKLYKLILHNNSDSKHYFTSSNFSNSIFTRKVQIIKDDKKIAEVKGKIDNIEVFPNNKVEWWLVPIRTGKFNDLFCEVKDKETGAVHADMGMKGQIIIE